MTSRGAQISAVAHAEKAKQVWQACDGIFDKLLEMAPTQAKVEGIAMVYHYDGQSNWHNLFHDNRDRLRVLSVPELGNANFGNLLRLACPSYVVNEPWCQVSSH